MKTFVKVTLELPMGYEEALEKINNVLVANGINWNGVEDLWTDDDDEEEV